MAVTTQTRKLGKYGPNVPALGLGIMSLSGTYGEAGDDEARFKFLDRAYELGQTFWDTSDYYGDTEELLGKWFARTGKRDEIFVATKFGFQADWTLPIRSDPEYIKEACERSLKRLGIETIDLYYAHRLDGVTPVEDTIEALVELKRFIISLPPKFIQCEADVVRAGKIKYIGLSEMSNESLRRACAIHHVDAVQMEYSPFAPDVEDPETGCLQTCRELGVALVAYSPTGRGFITGRFKSPDDFEKDDMRRILPRFQGENFAKNLKLVEHFRALAEVKRCTPTQLCLAFLMAQGDDIIPIPGTKNVKYLEENAASLNVTLSQEEVADFRRVMDSIEVLGARYPEKYVLASEPLVIIRLIFQ